MSDRIEVEGIDVETYAGKAALAVKRKVRGVMGDELLTFTLIDFVSIMLINNKFTEKGIIITDDNKEECYVKIIEMGDDSLIDDLEKFINLKDKIKKIQLKKDEYVNIIEQLYDLDDHNDEQSVKNIIEEYLRR